MATKTPPTPPVNQTPPDEPSAMGSTFAERRAARLGLPMPDPVQPTPASSTFAERRAARVKAIQDAENKAISGAETK